MEKSDFNIKTREIELKYDAEGIELKKFNDFAYSLNPVHTLEVGSWDSYYANNDEKSDVEFLRFRQGNKPELTTKVKLNDKNNNDRIEIDLPLNPNLPKEELDKVVGHFCDQLNFKLNFKIFKFCSIFFYEKIDIVYYIVYNEDMKEKGRFIEIEARKDATFASQEEALTLVKEMEAKFSIFGITLKNRMKKSQWEMWRK